MTFEGISYIFQDWPLRNGDGRRHFLDGRARIKRTGPDFKGDEKWVVLRIQLSPKTPFKGIDDYVLELEDYLRRDEKKAAEIEEQLKQAAEAAEGK